MSELHGIALLLKQLKNTRESPTTILACEFGQKAQDTPSISQGIMSELHGIALSLKQLENSRESPTTILLQPLSPNKLIAE